MHMVLTAILVLLSTASFAEVIPQTYVTAPPNSTIKGTPTVYDNMPPYKTQDGFGICFGSVGGAYLDMLNCKYNKAYDCKNLPDSKSFSRIAIGKYAAIMPSNTLPSQYKGIYPESARNATNILSNVIVDKLSAPSEQCASLEKALANFQDNDSYTMSSQILFSKLESKYYEFQKKRPCPTCEVTMTAQDTEDMKLFESSFNLKQNNVDLLKAFSEKTYGEFLEKLLIPNCNRSSQRVVYDGPPNIEVKDFPGKNLNTNYEAVIAEIKNKLEKKTPVILNDLCDDENYDTTKGCIGDTKKKIAPKLHTLIISGYRMVCPPKGECFASVKVYNSYGATWQQSHDDGWVDARTLLDRTGYKSDVLTWAEEKTATAKNNSKGFEVSLISANQK
jgi:hypothetical protein